jgi:hypothetical protein
MFRPSRELVTGELLAQHDRPMLIVADQMERVLADVDTERPDSAAAGAVPSWDGSLC